MHWGEEDIGDETFFHSYDFVHGGIEEGWSLNDLMQLGQFNLSTETGSSTGVQRESAFIKVRYGLSLNGDLSDMLSCKASKQDAPSHPSIDVLGQRPCSVFPGLISLGDRDESSVSGGETCEVHV